MPEHARPINGFLQPANGYLMRLSFILMKGQPKKRKYVGFMREVLAQNVRQLIDHHYKDSDNRPKALANDTGLSLSSVQRVLSAEAGASIDTIEVIANAFDLSTYHLVLPNLDAQNPQVVAGASSAERAMYAQFRRGQSRMENEKT
jgi:DNA-binding phage protein